MGPKAHPHRQGLLHVAPAGMFSPSPLPADTPPIQGCIPLPVGGAPARSEAELGAIPGIQSPGLPQDLPRQLQALIAQELEEELGLRLAELPGAQLRLTGIAFNLLNLRPEICTLLVLGHPVPLRLSPEYHGPPLCLDAAPPARFFSQFDAGAITPPGAGALYLGLSTLMP